MEFQTDKPVKVSGFEVDNSVVIDYFGSNVTSISEDAINLASKVVPPHQVNGVAALIDQYLIFGGSSMLSQLNDYAHTNPSEVPNIVVRAYRMDTFTQMVNYTQEYAQDAFSARYAKEEMLDLWGFSSKEEFISFVETTETQFEKEEWKTYLRTRTFASAIATMANELNMSVSDVVQAKLRTLQAEYGMDDLASNASVQIALAAEADDSLNKLCKSNTSQKVKYQVISALLFNHKYKQQPSRKTALLVLGWNVEMPYISSQNLTPELFTLVQDDFVDTSPKSVFRK